MPAGFPITAISAVNALGDGIDEVLAGLRTRATAVTTTVEVGQSGGFPCGAIPGEWPRLPSGLHAFETRQTRLAAWALDGCLPAVARAIARFGSDRVALLVGTSTGGIAATEAALAVRAATGELPPDYAFERHHGLHHTVEVLRRITGIAGPSWVVSTACSSSAKVVASARRLLAAGLCDAALIGGVDTLCQLTLRGFHALELLSRRPCRPFAPDRDGISLGEGGAFLVLEREGDSDVRVLGVGESSDAHHMNAPHPEGVGAELAMRRALADAGLEPSAIGHLRAHGTGTAQGDRAEALAIARVLGPGATVVACKGYTGHLLGAAGATELAIAIAGLLRGWVPGAAGAEAADAELPIELVVGERPTPHGAVLCNTTAFGGSNAAIVIGGDLG